MGIGVTLHTRLPLASVRVARHIAGSAADWLRNLLAVYSPRPNLNALQSCANLAAKAQHNDENVLVIRGDKSVADIYLGEFMRLHSHYAFRDAVAIHVDQGGKPTDWRPQFLQDSDAWQVPYFDAGDSSGRSARREFFSQGI